MALAKIDGGPKGVYNDEVTNNINSLIDNANALPIPANLATDGTSLVDIITLAEAGNIIVGSRVNTTEYHAGKGVGAASYILIEAASAAARPEPDGGSIIHVTTSPLYYSLVSEGDANLSQFGMCSSGGLGGSAYESAVKYAYDNDKAVNVDTTIHGNNTTATQQYHIQVKGSGTLFGLTININMLTDLDDVRSTFEGFKFAGSVSRNDTIKFIKGRNVSFSKVKFIDLVAPISSDAIAGTAFHSIGLIEVANCKFIACNSPCKFTATNPENRPFNDIQWKGNENWFCKEYGFYAEQLDGLTYGSNLSHFNDNVTTAKNHISVTRGEQIVIGSGNTNFNCGEDGYYFEDTTHLQIGGANRFWHPGQNTPSSGIKVVNSSSYYLSLTLDGSIHVEKPSLHLFDIQAPQGLVTMSGYSGVVDVRVAYNASTNPTGFFYGAEDLTVLAHYGINAPLGCEVISAPTNLKLINSGGVLLNIANNFPAKESQTYTGTRSINGSTEATKTITTNALTTLFRVFDSVQTNGDGSGEILVNAYGPTGKRATYKLLVCVDDSGASITTVATVGKTAGGAADEPSFTFGIYAGGDVHITRVNTTVSGTFDFVIYSQGDVYPRNLS